MLVKPDIEHERLVARLQAEYRLRIVQLAFLPLGGDLSTAVYRATADDETSYFCKLKQGVFDETTVALPKFLSGQGVAQIIPPLATKTGQLRAELDDFKFILYPFVEGKSGYEVELSAGQWADFGAALNRLHKANAPPAIRRNIREESYSPEWRERCRNVTARLDHETFDDPLTSAMAEFLLPKREMILGTALRAEQLAYALASSPLDYVLCHADIHPGNLLIATEGTLFIVDWDYPMLAPKERDLMFIGGGQGFMPYVAEREETLFYRGYGPSQADPIALTYYRYERGITDITVERILSSTLDSRDRAQSLEILKLYFLPGCTLEIAYASDRARGDGRATR